LGKITVDAIDFQTLDVDGKYSDAVVSAFLLTRINFSQREKCKIISFDSLLTLGISNGNDYRRYIQKQNLLDYDVWLYPVLVRFHWILFVVSFKFSIILCLVSTHKHDNFVKTVLPSLQRFMQSVYLVSKGHVIDWSEWSFVFPTDIPNQGSSNDCGVHVWIWYPIICSRTAVNFSQSHTTLVRKYIVKELLTFELVEGDVQSTRYIESDTALVTSHKSSRCLAAKKNLNRISEHFSSTLEFCSLLLSG
jgi:hypothetical protein